MAESAAADASSYDVGSPASVKNILGEYLSGGCDSLSDLRGMTGLVAPGVDVGWSEAESFGCAESVDSVREMSVTREGSKHVTVYQKSIVFGHKNCQYFQYC